jgi:hypothetical protein
VVVTADRDTPLRPGEAVAPVQATGPWLVVRGPLRAAPGDRLRFVAIASDVEGAVTWSVGGAGDHVADPEDPDACVVVAREPGPLAVTATATIGGRELVRRVTAAVDVPGASVPAPASSLQPAPTALPAAAEPTGAPAPAAANLVLEHLADHVGTIADSAEAEAASPPRSPPRTAATSARRARC